MKFLCVLLTSLALLHCAQAPWKPSEAPIGESKSLIVETLGGPQRSWRKDGRDYWFYELSGSQPSERAILVFENGVLVQKLRPGQNPNFEELEAELKKLQPQSPKEFETLSE